MFLTENLRKYLEDNRQISVSSECTAEKRRTKENSFEFLKVCYLHGKANFDEMEITIYPTH